MTRSSFWAAALIALPLLSTPALSQDGTGADQVIATVNDQPITLGQMMVLQQAMNDPSIEALPKAQLWDMLKSELVRQAVVAQSAQENAGLRAEVEFQRRNILAAGRLKQLAKAEPTEAELQAAYDKAFGHAEAVTEYNAAHILVDSKEKADEIKAKLDGGADFGDIAEQNSTGPSGPNRGDLGWFTPDQMVKPFAEAVESLKAGQISDPVQTDFGWHVIKLNDTRLRAVPPLSEVREDVSQLVLREKLESEVQHLVESAKVEDIKNLNPELLSQTNLLEAQ